MLLDYDPHKRLAELQEMQDPDPERAAIMEFDGGLSRDEADASAARLACPNDTECGNLIPLWDREYWRRKRKDRAA